MANIITDKAEKVGFWAIWEAIETAKAPGKYLDNLELHYIEISNAFYDGGEGETGLDAAEAKAKSIGFESVEHTFKAVALQAEEDFYSRSFCQ